jgi:uncharacterized oligopeptide transporter (OPT) family protein
MVGGALVGIILTLIEHFAPRVSPYMPSPTGMGLAFVIPCWNSISMFVGSVIAWGLERRAPTIAERYTIPVSSGFIAGESIMGIVVAVLAATGVLG